MRRIGFLRVDRGDNLGDPEFWNTRFEDIDLRLSASEEVQARIDAVLDEVVKAGLARLDNTLTPLIQNAYEQIAEIPAIFTATSASSVAIGTGTKSFVVSVEDRDTWVDTQMVFIRATVDPTKWMLGEVISFDRLTGVMQVNVSEVLGSGTFALWTISVSGRRGPQGDIGPQGLTPRGLYSDLTQYQPRDVVRYDRSAWIAKIATIGNSPPAIPLTENTQWQLLVERGRDGIETGAFERVYSETVSAGPQTTFTITGGYSPDASTLVFLNGVLLTEEDYTATNGTTVVLGQAAQTGDVFVFHAFAVFAVGEVPKLDLNGDDYPDKDTFLVNMGGTSVGRAVFKAVDQAAARTAIDAAPNIAFLRPDQTANLSVGYTATAKNLGTLSSFTLNGALGQKQYGTNSGAFTITAPTADTDIDLLITNDGTAGSVTFSGFTVGAVVGDALTTTNGHRFLVSIRRINGVSTYMIKALQ